MKKIAADRNYRMFKRAEPTSFSREEIQDSAEEWKQYSQYDCKDCSDEDWFNKAKKYALDNGLLWHYTGE